jgi:sugar lactone lactonase YvrE
MFYLASAAPVLAATVLSAQTITTQPTNQTVLAGSTAMLCVAVSGDGPFAYQWQFNGTNLPNGIITTVAGNGSQGYSGDGGAATNASLRFPSGVAVDASGNLFIADMVSRVRKVNPNGIITTLAGNGSPGFSGDGSAATNASLYNPLGVAVDAAGNLFIADKGNNRIRKVNTGGIITTVAGNGSSGYSGDGGAAINAGLYNPAGVAVDGFGNLFIADRSNRIRKVDTNGIITTVAGNGDSGYSGDGDAATNASLYLPQGVAVDASGNFFIADRSNNRIRKVDTNGIITTVAGNGDSGYSGDGGAATNNSLFLPSGVALDASGNLFIADFVNNRIRNVDTNGIITTIAGNGDSGYSGDGGAATNASLYYPAGVALDASGNLFIADTSNYHVREVALFASYPTLTLCNVTTNNTGNYTVVITGPGGSVTSSIVTLTVVDVNIMAQPQSLIVTNGSPTSFIVSVSGPGPFTCQWQLNGTNLPNGIITTVAGNYWFGGGGWYSGDGGPATNASLNWPADVAVNASGNLFIADTMNKLIRKVDANGIITTVAGNGGFGGYSGDGSAATNTSLSETHCVALDTSGNLFISFDGCIRKVDANGIITTVAGNDSLGYSGDGGPATNASLNNPYGLVVDASGNLFIADEGNNRIRKVDTNGIITTVAGNGPSGYSGSYSGDGGAATNANLNWPYGVAVDASGNLFISDKGNNRVRKVNANGIITTVAGNGSSGYSGDGGAATYARLNNPCGIAVDTSGNLFIADNNNHRIRKVNSAGIITTVAGGSGIYYPNDGGAATNSSLYYPAGLALDTSGNLFIADAGNQLIREVMLFSYPILTLNNATTNNAGNYTVSITSPYGSITSSIVTLNVASSPLISRSVLNPDGSVTLDFVTAPNVSSRVLAATNLTPPVLWQPIFTNVAGPAGAWQFSDTNAASQSVRFYRSSTP